MAATPTAGMRYRRMIFRVLGATYPEARCELNFQNPYELLVATVLSAQCTDQRMCDSYGGDVPRTLEQLTTLPGVGRKTANVVLGDAFGIPGITVDTHLARLSHRFGWSSQTNPDRIEVEVAALFPRKDWTTLSHRVIWHGRRCCHARKPACGACPVARWCPSYGIGPTDPVQAARLLKTSGPR